MIMAQGDKYTSMEVHTVGYIASHPSCTVTEIAITWGKTKSAVAQLIKRLKKASIVSIQMDLKDEKIIYLYLTKRGQELDKTHRKFDEHALMSAVQTVWRSVRTLTVSAETWKSVTVPR